MAVQPGPAMADHHSMHSMLRDLRPVLAARDLLRADLGTDRVVERLQLEYQLDPEETQLVLDAAWAMLRYEQAVGAGPPRW
jgi:hypothetical protein